MAEGLHFATLATLVGRRDAARYGRSRCTISAVGYKNGARYVMGILRDGTVVLGEPGDFTAAPVRGSRSKPSG